MARDAHRVLHGTWIAAMVVVTALSGCGGTAARGGSSGARSSSTARTEAPAHPGGPLTLSVTPAVGLADRAREIVVSGVTPNGLVTVRARTQRQNGYWVKGGYWVSSATFRAGADGRVDLATSSPVAGAYARADSMGLFWAQHRVGGPAAPDPDRVVTGLTATVGGRAPATSSNAPRA